MRRTKIFLATAAVLVAMLAAFAAPAMADNRHNDNRHNDNCCNNNFFDRHDDLDVDDNDVFLGAPFLVVDDVDVENVANRNPLEGDCFLTDLDFDGFIAEGEVTCFR